MCRGRNTLRKLHKCIFCRSGKVGTRKREGDPMRFDINAEENAGRKLVISLNVDKSPLTPPAIVRRTAARCSRIIKRTRGIMLLRNNTRVFARASRRDAPVVSHEAPDLRTRSRSADEDRINIPWEQYFLGTIAWLDIVGGGIFSRERLDFQRRRFITRQEPH